VIFGRRISKHYRGKLQTEIEDMDAPVLRSIAFLAMAPSASAAANRKTSASR
jgi:hypothetical protein